MVVASGGYPGPFEKGFPVEGLEALGNDGDLLVFHSGTDRSADGRVITSGGRVLTVVGLGESIAQARTRAYSAVSDITFEGARYRSDIALKTR